MKARVKATGDIVEISEDCSYVYAEHFDKSYNINELEFLNVKEKPFPKDEDYWARLERQAAIAAMQGILNNSLLITGLLKVNKSHEDIVVEVTDTAIRYAHALVEKLKNTNK